ncbi:MAG: FtsW/RodA/SpoVE family cell cycle protein, partial [Defluviitaleaceae bacterium]|nr:FtsW/RodA/SpoVE family cell cycle protein [Defluviitaleaceae bacterium]
ILFGLGLLAMGGASVLSYQLFPHLRIRVAAWQNPWADIADGGFQIAQSLFAIGSPGAFGAGLGLGMPERIPVVERDMIFSAISEEFGWIFALGIMAVFALILARSMQIASRQSRPLYGMMAMGFSVLIGFQAFIAIGGNVKFIPMTGITLPLMSYGGSSVFVIMLMFGFLQTFNRINDEGTEPDE